MDEHDNLKATDLQTLLRARGLPTSYRLKTDLIERLRNHRSRSTSQQPHDTGVFDDAGDTNGTNEQQVDEVFQQIDLNGDEDQNIDQSNLNGANDEAHINNGDNLDEINHTNNDTMAPIGLKDVEDSLDKFHGEPHENLSQWIETFEEIADNCKWDEPHQFLFAKRLLAGAAKKNVQSAKTRTIISYATLIDYLKTEYKDESSILDIHTKLTNKKKSQKESYLEYMYDMIRLSNERIDDPSLIRYIADGIQTSIQNKITLYESVTMQDLKHKLKIFETLQFNQDTRTKDDKSKQKTGQKPADNRNRKTQNGAKRCVNCGERDHQSDECPDKEKGRKCFNCDI